MGRKTLGQLGEDAVKKYDEEADELGLSRTQYVQNCIEVGRLVFQTSGDIDIERLRTLTEGPGATTIDSDLETAEGDLTTTILENLPTEEHRALTKDEIRKAVFGTEAEQNEQITETLKQLRQAGKIEPLVDGGYIKTNE